MDKVMFGYVISSLESSKRMHSIMIIEYSLSKGFSKYSQRYLRMRSNTCLIKYRLITLRTPSNFI